MSVIREIRELAPRHVSVALLTVMATVSTGTLVLFQFQRALFTSLDWFRFVLLAVSLPLPSLATNTVLLGWLFELVARYGKIPVEEKGDGSTMATSYVAACLCTALTFAVGLLLSSWRHWCFLGFAVLLLGSHVLLTLCVGTLQIGIARAKAKQTPKPVESGKTETQK